MATAIVKRDDVKQKWEQTEFPLVCETCLGDNPYVRMTKEHYGKKCRVCDVPFTVFAWQAGTKGRLKKVEICRQCAKTKNVCQVCIFDLQYGLPVQVRDRVLAEHGCSGGSGIVAAPQSDANRSWQAQSKLEMALPSEVAAAKLRQMARLDPRYERNLAKPCSFFARGECNRGLSCPFRHEMPKDRNDPFSKQNTRDRFYGTNDPVAARLFFMQKQKEEQAKGTSSSNNKRKANEEEEEEAATVLPTTLYCRFGDEAAPVDETMVRDKFYSFGEIVSVRFADGGKICFVEFTSSASTELAIDSTNRQSIGGAPCHVSWARSQKRGNPVGPVQGPLRPLPAPGSTSTLATTPYLKPLSSSSSSNKKVKPIGFVPLKPSPEVLAAARNRAAAAAQTASSKANASSLQRPRAPIYPSRDPGRLGTRVAKPP